MGKISAERLELVLAVNACTSSPAKGEEGLYYIVSEVTICSHNCGVGDELRAAVASPLAPQHE